MNLPCQLENCNLSLVPCQITLSVSFLIPRKYKAAKNNHQKISPRCWSLLSTGKHTKILFLAVKERNSIFWKLIILYISHNS